MTFVIDFFICFFLFQSGDEDKDLGLFKEIQGIISPNCLIWKIKVNRGFF